MSLGYSVSGSATWFPTYTVSDVSVSFSASKQKSELYRWKFSRPFLFPGLVVKLCFPVILFRYQNPTLDLLGPNWSDLPAYKREKGNEDDPRCFLSLLLSPSVSLSLSHTLLLSLTLSYCLKLSLLDLSLFPTGFWPFCFIFKFNLS